MINILPLASIAPTDVEQLLDDAFGSDRRQRTAYRLREGIDAIADLSLAAIEDGKLVGSIQCWPVELVADDGSALPLILVGPVAVRPGRQREGIGRKLMDAALANADARGSEPLMLIGDAIYYDRFFGFSAQHTRGWILPGPVDRDRLLARLRPGQTVPENGVLRPRATAKGAHDTLEPARSGD